MQPFIYIIAIIIAFCIIALIIKKMSNKSGPSLINGPCPYCENEQSVTPGLPGYQCKTCGKRFIIHDKKFIKK